MTSLRQRLASGCMFGIIVGAFSSGACLGDGGGGGLPLFDRGSCDVLIECASSLAPSARDEYENAYGPNGTCWANGPNAWAACRDVCRMALDALNLVAMASGETCGACTTNADCSAYGMGATCQAGLCTGGSGGTTGDEANSADATSAETASDTNDTNDTQDTNDSNDTNDECDPVAEVCQDLIDCLEVALPGVDTSSIGPGSDCWCGTAVDANSCINMCVEQLAAAKETYSDLEACVGPIDPCPDGSEGCECIGGSYCNDNLVCDAWDYVCEAPNFGVCDTNEPFHDPFCPDSGCDNGYVYLDQNYDGEADFAMCRFYCTEEYGPGQCNDSVVGGYVDLTGDPECFDGGWFGFQNGGLVCVNTCDVTECPDGAVCVQGNCWYDLP